MGQELTTEQIENIVIDAGVVYINYGEIGERILAPTRGGNGFVVERTIKDILYDGRKGKTKGMRRIIEENAKLTVALMDLSMDNLALALAGATFSNADRYARITEYLGVGAAGTDPEVLTLAQTPINPTVTGSMEFWIAGVKVAWTYGTQYTISGTTLTIASNYVTTGQEVVVSYKYDTGANDSTIVPGDISDSDYITNVAIVGVDLEGKSKIIYVYNALSDNNFGWKMVDKDESVLTVDFSAHWDPEDLDPATSPPYKIVEVAA